MWAVGERSAVVRSSTVRSCGRGRSENVGTSSDKTGEKPVRRKPKVSWARLILPGLVGPKQRPRGVCEGKRVNNPYQLSCFIDGVTQKVIPAGTEFSVWCCRSALQANPQGSSENTGNPNQVGGVSKYPAAEKSF